MHSDIDGSTDGDGAPAARRLRRADRTMLAKGSTCRSVVVAIIDADQRISRSDAAHPTVGPPRGTSTEGRSSTRPDTARCSSAWTRRRRRESSGAQRGARTLGLGLKASPTPFVTPRAAAAASARRSPGPRSGGRRSSRARDGRAETLVRAREEMREAATRSTRGRRTLRDQLFEVKAR